MERDGSETRRLRDRFCIVAEILVVARDGSLKPQLMYRADLNFAQMNRIPFQRSLAQKKFDMLARIEKKDNY